MIIYCVSYEVSHCRPRNLWLSPPHSRFYMFQRLSTFISLPFHAAGASFIRLHESNVGTMKTTIRIGVAVAEITVLLYASNPPERRAHDESSGSHLRQTFVLYCGGRATPSCRTCDFGNVPGNSKTPSYLVYSMHLEMSPEV